MDKFSEIDSNITINDIAASYQEAIIDVLSIKIMQSNDKI